MTLLAFNDGAIVYLPQMAALLTTTPDGLTSGRWHSDYWQYLTKSQNIHTIKLVTTDTGGLFLDIKWHDGNASYMCVSSWGTVFRPIDGRRLRGGIKRRLSLSAATTILQRLARHRHSARARALAIAMAFHPRLGAASCVRLIDPHLVRLFGPQPHSLLPSKPTELESEHDLFRRILMRDGPIHRVPYYGHPLYPPDLLRRYEQFEAKIIAGPGGTAAAQERFIAWLALQRKLRNYRYLI